jgi:hypothetical protein
MADKQASEESIGGLCISSLLEQHINDLIILVDRPPQVPLLASDSNEDLINEERVAVAAVPAPQSKRIPWSELIAPQANRFVGDDDASLSQQVFDIPVAEVEPIVEPDDMLDDRRGKSVPLVRGHWALHSANVAQCRLTWQYRLRNYSSGELP